MPAIMTSKRRSSYLFQQDFPVSGTPAGWTFNGTGSCNYNVSGPDGIRVVQVASTTNSNLGGAQYNLSGLGITATFGWYSRQRFASGAGLNRNAWHLDNSEFWIAAAADTWNGGLIPDLIGATWYHMWIDATPSSRSLYLHTTGTKPASPTVTVSGSFAAPSRIAISLANSSGQSIGKIRIASGPIGSNPA